MVQNSFTAGNGYAQSSILGVSDMGAIMPDYQATLFNTFGDQYTNDYELLMAMHGMMTPTVNTEGGFLFQEDRYDSKVTVLANAGTSGATLVFTLDPAEVGQLNGAPYVYPQINDIISDMTTNNNGIVTNVTFAGIVPTITAVSKSNTSWTTPVAGKEYAINGTAVPEASTGPMSRNSYWTKKEYKIQIMRQQATATDLALGAKLFPIRDQIGNVIANWGGESRMQMEYRLLKNVVTNLWVGEENLNVTPNNGTGTQSNTTGYFQEFSNFANQVNVGPANYTQHFADLTADLLENSPRSMYYYGLINANLVDPIQQDMQSTYANQNIEAVSKQNSQYMFGEGATPNMLVRFDFNTFIYNGMTYSTRTQKISYDPNTLGLNRPQNYFCNTAYFMPSKQGQDAQGFASRNCMLRYVDIPGVPQAGPRKILFIETGGLATVPTNNQMVRIDDCITWQGNQFNNLEQCGYFYKAVGS